MKRNVLIYLLLLCNSVLFAQSEKGTNDLFFKGTIAEAIAKAKTEGKRVMVMASASYCGPCKQLEANVYPTPEFREFCDKNNLLPIYYHELDKSDPDRILETYQIYAFPSFVFLDSDGNASARCFGSASTPQKFCDKLSEALLPENSLEARQKRLEEDPTYAYEYMMFLTTNIMRGGKEKTLYALLEKGPLENYFTDQWWEYYENYATYLDSGIINFMLDHPEKVIAVIGQEKYEQFLHDRGVKLIGLYVIGSRKRYDIVRRVLQFAEVHPQLETSLSRFFRKNIDLVESGDGVELFNETMNWIKDADTESRKVLWQVSTSGLKTLERSELEKYFKKVCTECLKYEQQPAARAFYERNLGSLK